MLIVFLAEGYVQKRRSWVLGVSDKLVDIWRRITEGDTVAWEELVQKYARLVFHAALRTGLTSAEAEDCVQQTWLALYNSRFKIEQPDQLPSWLISTTRRKAWRFIQRRDKASEVYSQLAPMKGVETPDEELMRAQQAANLELALDQLGGRCAKLLRAIFFSPEKLSYKEIARSMGIPPNSLGPTRVRCLSKLRKILEEIENE